MVRRGISVSPLGGADLDVLDRFHDLGDQRRATPAVFHAAFAMVKPERLAGLGLHRRHDGPGIIERVAADVTSAVVGLVLDQRRGVADLGGGDLDGPGQRVGFGQADIGEGPKLPSDAGADLVGTD